MELGQIPAILAHNIQIAVNSIVLKYTFFAALLLNLIRRPTDDASFCKTLQTDGVYLYYNVDFMATLNIYEMMFGLAHEALHCALGHLWRRGNRNAKRWNRAADYVVNGILRRAGFTPIKGSLDDPQYDGLSVEVVYSMLTDEGEEQEWGQGDCTQQGNPDGGPTTPQQKQLDAEELANRWEIKAREAAQVAKAMGKLPAHLEKAFTTDLDAKEDWTTRLREWHTEVNRENWTYSRPNKRYIHTGLILPTLYSTELGHTVIVKDVSGSCGPEYQQAFDPEMKDIHNEAKPCMTTVIYCGARVERVDEFTALDTLELHDMYGGGTSFVPPFKYVEDQGIQPVCLIYLTDMYGDFPKYEPDYPVLWVSVSKGVVAPFGETIEIVL